MPASSPFPYDTPSNPETVDPRTGKKVRSPFLDQSIVDWLLEQQQRTDNSAQQAGSIGLATQGASIATTPLPMPAVTEGLYRVSVYARVTRAGSVSSSLIVTIGFTDGGVSCVFATPALTTNTTASVVTATYVLRSDAATAISYAVTYADGGGANNMLFDLVVRVEALP